MFSFKSFLLSNPLEMISTAFSLKNFIWSDSFSSVCLSFGLNPMNVIPASTYFNPCISAFRPLGVTSSHPVTFNISNPRQLVASKHRVISLICTRPAILRDCKYGQLLAICFIPMLVILLHLAKFKETISGQFLAILLADKLEINMHPDRFNICSFSFPSANAITPASVMSLQSSRFMNLNLLQPLAIATNPLSSTGQFPRSNALKAFKPPAPNPIDPDKAKRGSNLNSLQ
mmetsp:Transcript_17063/g.16403  ORF Transcript_17063/g.16403 Transcript_17063/m.16403 type:complete len:231 (+) Transcript_17063:440-1132(+)